MTENAEHALWFASLVVEITLLLRVVYLRSASYRWFTVYLALSSAGSLILMPVPLNTNPYAWTWIAVELIPLFMLYAAALEIFQAVASHVPTMQGASGLVRHSRVVLTALLCISVLGAVAFSIDARSPGGWTGLGFWLRSTMLLKRIVMSSLALYLILTLRYFLTFGVKIKPNLRRHMFCFTAWSTTTAIHNFLWNLLSTNRYRPALNISFLSLGIVCYSVWILAFTRKGERVESAVSAPVDNQLQAIREHNAVMGWLAEIRRR